MTKWRRLAWVAAGNNKSWLTPMTVRRIEDYCSRRIRRRGKLTLLGGRGNVCSVETLLEVSVADALARDVTSRGVTRGRWERECQYYHREETEGIHHAAITARNPLHMVPVCPLTAKWSDLHSGYFKDHRNFLMSIGSLKLSSCYNCQCEKLLVTQSLFVWHIFSCQWFLYNWLSVFLGLRSTLRPGPGAATLGPVCACAKRNAPTAARWGSEQRIDQDNTTRALPTSGHPLQLKSWSFDREIIFAICITGAFSLWPWHTGRNAALEQILD